MQHISQCSEGTQIQLWQTVKWCSWQTRFGLAHLAVIFFTLFLVTKLNGWWAMEIHLLLMDGSFRCFTLVYPYSASLSTLIQIRNNSYSLDIKSIQVQYSNYNHLINCHVMPWRHQAIMVELFLRRHIDVAWTWYKHVQESLDVWTWRLSSK